MQINRPFGISTFDDTIFDDTKIVAIVRKKKSLRNCQNNKTQLLNWLDFIVTYLKLL